MGRLKVDPPGRRGAEIAPQSKGGIGRYGSATGEDFSQAGLWYVQGPCQCVGVRPRGAR